MRIMTLLHGVMRARLCVKKIAIAGQWPQMINFSHGRVMKYKIGTKFKTRHRHPRLCKVVDILRTYNEAQELVRVRYVAVHLFGGQVVTDNDVVECTITMGLQND
jgi:hypothetical protein